MIYRFHHHRRPAPNGLLPIAAGGTAADRAATAIRRYIKGTRMDDVISKLTAEQALKIVERLGRKGGDIQEAVRTEAMNVLTEINLDETAEEVLLILDSIDVQDCWDRSGSSHDGYTSPDEVAAEIIEQELQPFSDQVERYHELGMPEQEAAYCMGVILGIYRYERESKSEFREWSADIPVECGGFLLDKWRKRNQDKSSIHAMHEFIRGRCAEWSKRLIDK
jgi:hypothetical protein